MSWGSTERVRKLGGEKIDFVTYVKGKRSEEPDDAFYKESFSEDGVSYLYELADRSICLNLTKEVDGQKSLSCRQITRRREGGRQTQIGSLVQIRYPRRSPSR